MSRRLERAKRLWRWTGEERPPWALPPGPGQESVWDYPRPPRLEKVRQVVTVGLGGVEVAATSEALRVLETASPPTVYLPRTSVDQQVLRHCAGSSVCEWKGAATYWSLEIGSQTLEAVGWSYERPFREYEVLARYLSFYPARVECTLGGEPVTPQAGGFYGGWVTPDIIGPMKGEPGSGSW